MSASIRQDRPASSGSVIPAGHVQVVHRHEPQTVECEQIGGARVTLIKDAGIVRAIEIVCACGEVIRLDCEYATEAEVLAKSLR